MYIDNGLILIPRMHWCIGELFISSWWPIYTNLFDFMLP